MAFICVYKAKNPSQYVQNTVFITHSTVLSAANLLTWLLKLHIRILYLIFYYSPPTKTLLFTPYTMSVFIPWSSWALDIIPAPFDL